MLYHLFKYFDNVHNLPGAGMFQYISFRAAAAIIIALLIVIVFGRNIINFLRRRSVRRSAIWGSKDNSRRKARPRWAA
jgi:phospho-N-acetylmuramoyl-pentapeptide-transferase